MRSIPHAAYGCDMAPTLNFIGLIVTDMGRTLDFYRALGVPVPDGADGEPHVEAVLPGFKLAWDTEETIASFNPDWKAVEGAGRVGLAFECDSPAEVDRVYAELVAAGHHGAKEPWDAFWGQRYALVSDPDGNEVSLFAALPTG